MRRLLLTWMLSVALIGCEGGDLPRGPASPDGGAYSWPDLTPGGPVYGDQGQPPPAVDQGAAPGADTTTSSTSSCPRLDGDWEGVLSGTTTGFFSFTVSGTMSLTLGPDPAGQPGDYVVTAGQMVAHAKGLEAFPFTYAVTGKVSCGTLLANNTVSIFGVQSSGKCTCTFNEAGCKGSWDGQTTDGSSKGAGSFEVHRKN